MIELGFWKNLPKPFFCLAPMADVTDCAFRYLIAKYSGDARPTERSFGRVFFTEFVSADGLAHFEAKKKLIIDLKYGKNEHPIVAQIFGSNPENIKKAARLCKKLGFDGIDINMGCPDRAVEKQCAGAAMMKDHKLAKEIIQAAKEGAPDLPISVKTRLGYNKIETETWIPALLEEDLAALSIHLRTRKEMSDVPAHWEVVKRIVEIRNQMNKSTLIIGNGDVKDLEEAGEKAKEYGCDGIMLGRAIFGNPWLFANSQLMNADKKLISPDESIGVDQNKISVSQRLVTLVEHTKLFEKMLGKHKNFAIMKKHFKAYANGFEGAKELRMKLMETENAKEVEKITLKFLENNIQ